MEEQDNLVTKLQKEVAEMEARQADRENERKEMELLAERGEEIEAERELLQQRVVEQQVQVSSLQAALQASRLRTGSTGEEKWVEERNELRAEVEALKSELRRVEREGETGRQQASLLQTRLIQLEEELQANGNSAQLPCQQCASYGRDVAELRSVQEKLQGQLSAARAAQLAAQRTELPVLAQRLLDEKNQELETLRNQQHYHSTPQPQSWSSRLEDSKVSMEQLRDASSQGGMRLMLQESKFQSGIRMEPLEGDTRGSQYMAGNLEEEAASKEVRGNLTGTSSQTGAEMTPRIEMALDEKVAQIELMTKILNDKEEQLDNLNDTLKEKEKQLDLISLTLKEKEKQLENLTAALQEKEEQLKSLNKNFRLKEELLESLQKNNTELTVMIEDLKEEAETASSKSQEEEARLRGEVESATSRGLELQDQLNAAVTERRKAESALQDARDQSVSLMNQLEEAKSKLSEVEMRSLEETGHEVVEEVRRAREEREDLMRGMDNLHSIIESGQRQLEEERQLASSTKSMEKLAMALEERQEKVDELEAALEQTGRSLRSKEDEVSSLLQTQLLAQGSSHTTELLQEKHELERQLEKITKDMAGVEKVVTEMTRSFKHQVQVKEGEARGER